jgi:hypothetical protein
MPIVNIRYLVTIGLSLFAICMLLKHILRGSQKKQKTPPFLYYIPQKGFAKNTRWRLKKISKRGPAGHP